ncbi:hypothetical protein Tco_0474079 [Tanacetum coccineum]
MYQDSWDKMIHTQCNARYEKLEKETQIKISNLEECVRIKDRQHIIRANDDFIIFENLRAQVKELQSENEHLKSKVVDCTMCQNLQVQVEELKSVNESLNLSVEELSKARALVEATLRERDEMISAQCKKIRLLEEQSEIFHEVPSEFDSEIVHDTQDNSEKDVILSLQTQLKETAELVVRFSDEKYCALKETESLKVEIKSLQTKNKVLKSGESELSEKIDQMKSQVSELSKSHFQIIVNIFKSNEISKYSDLLPSNDVLKQRLETKFKFSKHATSLEKMIKMIEEENESNVSKISITSSMLETNNLELVKEMGELMKCFDEEKKVFENKISNLEKDLAQRVKDFDDVKTELSRRTNKFETYFANLEKENALLKSQLTSQNYTSLQKENNDLRTTYNVLKEKYETSEKLEKENNDLKMHYKRLFDSIKQKKDRKYLKKQHSFKTFTCQNHVKNESSKQIWKRKGENISKPFKYSRNEMFSMRKRDDSVLKKVKDVRFPFISRRIFQNETPSFNNKWKSSSSSKVKTWNETPGFRTVFTPSNVL